VTDEQAVRDLQRRNRSPASARRSDEPPLVALSHVMRSHAVLRLTFRGVSASAVLAALISVAGLATAARVDDGSAIQQIMEQVHTRNRAIGKGLRAPTALEAAGRKGIAADAAFLVRLGKEVRGHTEPARERKKSQQDWTRAADDFLRSADDFAGVIADASSDRARVTRSYQKLQKTCTNCHSIFRGEGN
jgi:cytochrome c556